MDISPEVNNTILAIRQVCTISFCIDTNMQIHYPSQGLMKHVPCLKNDNSKNLHLEEIFFIHRPKCIASIEVFNELKHCMVLMIARDNSFAVRGQFINIAGIDNQLVFSGSPWLAWMSSEQPDYKLGIDDFSASDSQLDQLILISTDRQNMHDLEMLANELRTAKNRAEQAQRVQSDFFAIMSHDMRTPLNGVATALELVNSQEFDHENQHMLEVAKTSAKNLKSVIEHVLNYSKLEAGGFKNDPSEVDITSFIESIVTMFQVQSKEHGTELLVTLGRVANKKMLVDEAKLRQVLINLIANAFKYTRNGTITLSFGLDPVLSKVYIAVSDSGDGIPHDKQQHIFEPFWTFSNVGGGQRGTGLGLNICRRMVEIMGGEIVFSSTPGEGTTFSLELPISLCSSPMTRAAVKKSSQHRFTGKILLVEDDKTNQLLGQKLLERRGLNVSIAENGRQAVDAISKKHFDLVFMDISMPVMDGIEACRIIRLTKDREELPIIAMTAHAGESEHKEFIDSGMNAAMSKPVNTSILDETLNRWLNPTKTVQPEQTFSSEKPINSLIDDELPLFDIEVANLLRDEVGSGIFSNVTNLFFSEFDAKEIEIKQHYQLKEYAQLAKKAHSIRATAASLGCVFLGKLLKDIELSAKAEKLSKLNILMSQFSSAKTHSVKQLKDYCKD